ncbi:hypothetical protein PFISCL1PPCAC_11533, partial [Pristionchus fissidentatus]
SFRAVVSPFSPPFLHRSDTQPQSDTVIHSTTVTRTMQYQPVRNGRLAAGAAGVAGIREKIKPLYIQAVIGLLSFLLFCLLTAAVAKDEWLTATVTGKANMGGYSFQKKVAAGGGLISNSYGGYSGSAFSYAPTWAQACYVLLIFTIIFQILTIAFDALIHVKPALKKKLNIGAIVLQFLTFFICCLSLGLFNSNTITLGMSYGTSYNCVGACIFFTMVNFAACVALLILFP